MSLTAHQQQAVTERGNVLVVAGAGTGKTSTLVERCIHCLSEGATPASLDEILMVTFTEAAAAEMRHRIRNRLEELREAGKDALRWEEQLSLFETAHFGTLHSFCLKLIRHHFYELELDPQVVVLTQEDAKLHADETLEKILKEHYAGKTPHAGAVQELIQVQGRGSDILIRTLVLKLHHYTQTLRDPEKWIEDQLAIYTAEQPAQWKQWLTEGTVEWANNGINSLQPLLKDNPKAFEISNVFCGLKKSPGMDDCDEMLKKILDLDLEWPPKMKGLLRKPLESIFADAGFLKSLTRTDGKANPLEQDWKWVHGQMVTLLELTREFSTAYAAIKRELAGLDFHDLEQFALRLLLEPGSGKPTLMAHEWRRRLKFVFVDEYQDINEAQDAILAALSREGAESNRFLVGDVKQSIYRFRLADPRIFQRYMNDWRGGSGKSIPLSDNFRSREGILGFVNSLFSMVMTPELGGVGYEDEAHLKFGNAEVRTQQQLHWNGEPRVELHLRVTGGVQESDEHTSESEPSEGIKEWVNLEAAAREARMVALRLREMHQSGHLVWDSAEKSMRKVQWSDMAVLMRAPGDKMECYAREFGRMGVPLTVTRGGFYNSLEITDLLGLLQILDNPLQDIPALAVLRSPLVGMTVDDLAKIRLAVPGKIRLWSALVKFLECKPRPEDSTWLKANRFMENHGRWRRHARQVSLSRCLELVVQETHYADWLLTQPQGGQRHANVERLLVLARQFDQFQRQSLPRFLRFVEVQQSAETEPRVAALSGDDSVALMSIHQSKGLEFPVVAVADMAKGFNFQDLRSDIILDSKLGICPQIKPAGTGRRYASLPHWLARQDQKREMLGEELRLLYVALTRARDTLVLTGTVAQKKLEEVWPMLEQVSSAKVAVAKSYLDWLACWIYGSAGFQIDAETGSNKWLKWSLYEENDPRLTDISSDAVTENFSDTNEKMKTNPKTLEALRSRLEFVYPRINATKILAKTTVTQLRKQLADEPDAAPLHFKSDRSPSGNPARLTAKMTKGARMLNAAELGTLHHKYLSSVDLSKTGSMAELEAEAVRLVKESTLTNGDAAQLNLRAILGFWDSDLGKRIASESKNVRRELAFTSRFAANDLGNLSATNLDDDFVVVQGIADLVVIRANEIWLVDYKTDMVGAENLEERIRAYAPQVQLYAKALSNIYKRPVTEAWLYFLESGKAESVKP